MEQPVSERCCGCVPYCTKVVGCGCRQGLCPAYGYASRGKQFESQVEGSNFAPLSFRSLGAYPHVTLCLCGTGLAGNALSVVCKVEGRNC